MTIQHLLTVPLGQGYENELGRPIKRFLRAGPSLKEGSTPLCWGKRWGTMANGARYGNRRISERMSFEESNNFFAIIAYMAHIRQYNSNYYLPI